MERDQVESADWYDEPTIDHEIGPDHPLAGDGEVANIIPMPLEERIAQINATWPHNGAANEERINLIREAIDQHFTLLQDQFDDLYNPVAHAQLRSAIMDEIN
ncbi:hypothetical protein SEMRO_1707_G292560.1 [Seminavis robusta]|uniref:Uncharacterized protein n=1 Tax=Seminavis robusta TaxID=568900 RepID=A0A9N8HUW7_9STRA|nr:hypothetical protein SEMRO_1707_G292560.1 [Seminavis robusta]|eukprot:Sro1707_g292560.1 n/a (103) ;mRNA; r:1163-1471